MAVGCPDEVGNLFSGVRIDYPAELGRLARRARESTLIINDDADRDPFDTPKARYHLLRVVGLELVYLARVEKTGEHFAHVERMPTIRRDDVVDVRQGSRGAAGWLILTRRGGGREAPSQTDGI